ncbi:MAG: EF-hand domain-containing protein [Verrucomicrobiia bacterium]
MKTKIKIAAALLALGASALLVNAQDDNGAPPPNRPGPGRHHPPPLPLVIVLDANHDGVIDSNEIANASAALKTLDKNGDGQLTPDEYLPTLPAAASKDAPRPLVPAIVKALDVNGDGVIDANEIANAPAALQALDKNGDGKLTPDEFIGPRPHRGPPPGQNSDTPNGDQMPPPEGAPDEPPPGE